MSEGRYVDGRCGVEKPGGGACWNNGSRKYGGRCVQHGKALPPGQSAPPSVLRVWDARRYKASQCGSTETTSGYPCRLMVRREGMRCERHSARGLAEASAHRREDLAEKLERAITEKCRVDAKIAKLRSELDALTPKQTRSRQAEVRA